mmetsp:Transcript_30185/g.96371  ORF Transcript_30185/g.96371 Transcript_30185/m.96371 type:complete len:301 (+) Transcript_30185:876-1778(+)
MALRGRVALEAPGCLPQRLPRLVPGARTALDGAQQKAHASAVDAGKQLLERGQGLLLLEPGQRRLVHARCEVVNRSLLHAGRMLHLRLQLHRGEPVEETGQGALQLLVLLQRDLQRPGGPVLALGALPHSRGAGLLLLLQSVHVSLVVRAVLPDALLHVLQRVYELAGHHCCQAHQCGTEALAGLQYVAAHAGSGWAACSEAPPEGGVAPDAGRAALQAPAGAGEDLHDGADGPQQGPAGVHAGAHQPLGLQDLLGARGLRPTALGRLQLAARRGSVQLRHDLLGQAGQRHAAGRRRARS